MLHGYFEFIDQCFLHQQNKPNLHKWRYLVEKEVFKKKIDYKDMNLCKHVRTNQDKLPLTNIVCEL